MMSSAEDTLRGIIAIIVGILVIAVLFTKNFTINESLGIGIGFLGIWILVLSYDIKNFNKFESMLYFVLFLLSIITGVFLYFNIKLPISSYTSNLWIYISGILILISGIIALTGKETLERATGIIGTILGIIFLTLAYYSYNEIYLAYIIGIWLIIIGIIQFFISYDTEYEYGFYKFF